VSIRAPRFAALARCLVAKTLLQPRKFDPLLITTAQLVEALISAARAIGGLALFLW
jgi:hypothetical protein